MLSISWGVPELMWAPGQPAALDGVLKDGGAIGITICAASGDYSSGGIAPTQGNGPDGRANVGRAGRLPAHARLRRHAAITAKGRVAWNNMTGTGGGDRNDRRRGEHDLPAAELATGRKRATLGGRPATARARGADVAANAGGLPFLVAGAATST